jgi:integrase
MPTGNITKSAVDGFLAKASDQFLWDGKVPGFGLKVTPAGSKIYLYQYRLGGRGAKVRRFTIGKHGAISPDQARTEAKRLAMLVAQGNDPQLQKKETRRQAIDLAFAAYVDRFARDCLEIDWKASAGEVEAMLRTYAVPVIGDKPLPLIIRSDISAVIRPLRSKPASASKLFAVMRRLFRWAVSEGDIESSPMAGMEAPPKPDARDRFLEDEELALVWRNCQALGYPFGPMARLLILTGTRRNEVSDLPWSELSRDKRLWSLPAARAKNGEATDVPLSDMAVALLDSLAGKGNWPRRGFVFTTTGKTAVSGFSRAKTRIDALVTKSNGGDALPDWTLHDLRRTLATGMQRLGVRFEVTEALLNHKSGARSGVAGVYQRHDWGPEKRAALQAWADHIEGILSVTGRSSVVQLATVSAKTSTAVNVAG